MAEKKAAGRSHAATAAFAKKWCQTKLDELTIRKTKEEEVEDLSSLDAEYCTFNRIVSGEGGGPEGFASAKNWTISALGAWQSKGTFRGHPWIKYNDFRKKLLIAYTREAQPQP